MKLYYYKDVIGNFGDDLNSWLWDALIPDFFDQDESIRMSGIGTIINTAMPKADKWVVFSSGVGYGNPPDNFGDDSWDILSVRGPLSAKVLGLPKDKYITDGAALLNTLEEFKPLSDNERNGIIFIPHHHALLTGNWQYVCEQAGVEFVNLQWDAKIVINKIRGAKMVLADAMHAAIIADAMRVPWLPLITSPQINTFKWLDWTQTIQEKYSPLVLGSSSLRESIRSRSLGFYGEDYYIKNLTIDSALSDFYKKRAYKSKAWWPKYNKAAKKLVSTIPDKIALSLGETTLNKFDLKYIESAVKMVESCKTRQPFLSNDNVFYENVSKLMSCIDKVKKYKD
ncbi:polysaccharide pyruvyl transferase family protein [Escherichia coli]|uniref:polysaccharide pyruvyl transferase family protein n=1 Tax=Escherichia coli TaxID=562 RepID=UPI001E13002E|nr:polysaccharide pyruvyl transferase family protein [Escherichia coli]CAF2517210.1 Exopolysaccharide glucosyl ketal-pyruvate-transferase [Escherichia coli]CAH5240683.1 Exopolysaccharide glucosyl ketal-pyruvate-transferase [Escherichia coli]